MGWDGWMRWDGWMGWDGWMEMCVLCVEDGFFFVYIILSVELGGVCGRLEREKKGGGVDMLRGRCRYTKA
mgnify:FL=1